MTTEPDWQLAIDIDRCTGCHACSVACKAEHRIPLGQFRTKVYYHDAGQFPAVQRHFLPAFCMQCADAGCVSACPEKAIRRGTDGIVRIDSARCKGPSGSCRHACVAGCAYGAISKGSNGTADKCDFCTDRLDAGLRPSCVTACPTDSLIFGNAKDADSPIARFIASPRGQAARPIERGGQPQVRYRGADPRVVAKLPKGRPHDPRSYEIEQWSQEGQS